MFKTFLENFIFKKNSTVLQFTVLRYLRNIFDIYRKGGIGKYIII